MPNCNFKYIEPFFKSKLLSYKYLFFQAFILKNLFYLINFVKANKRFATAYFFYKIIFQCL